MNECEHAGVPAGVVLHEVSVGEDRRLVIDVAVGQAFLDDETPQQPDSAAAMLTFLYWCWEHSPFPVPTVLWQVEAAAWAARTSSQTLRNRALADLDAAVGGLRRVSSRFPVDVRKSVDVVAALLSDRESSEPGWLPAPRLLDLLVAGLRAAVIATRRRRPERDPGQAGRTLAGRTFEAEWHRADPVWLDPGKDAVGVEVQGTLWSASVRMLQPEGNDALWARLVDLDQTELLSQTRMVPVDGYYQCSGVLDGGLPPRWRAEIVADPSVPALGAVDAAFVHARQGVYRALLASRVAGPGDRVQARELSAHARRQLDCYLKTAGLAPVLGTAPRLAGCFADIGGPFLAEEAIEPAVLGGLLSPGGA